MNEYRIGSPDQIVIEQRINQSVGNLLTCARKARGFGQEEIARKIHRDQSVISRFETGMQASKISTLLQYVGALGNDWYLRILITANNSVTDSSLYYNRLVEDIEGTLDQTLHQANLDRILLRDIKEYVEDIDPYLGVKLEIGNHVQRENRNVRWHKPSGRFLTYAQANAYFDSLWAQRTQPLRGGERLYGEPTPQKTLRSQLGMSQSAYSQLESPSERNLRYSPFTVIRHAEIIRRLHGNIDIR